MKRKQEKYYARNDSGNAEHFAYLHGERLRFDHKRGRWLIWDYNRQRWVEDRTMQVRVLMKESARMRHRNALDSEESDERTRQIKWALLSENRYQIDAALELAKSEQPISDAGDGWDSDPMLFGVANGIVDLCNGNLRPATPQDQITQFSPVCFDASARCPLFEQFVAEIFCADVELIRYVQKAGGYSLTGSTQEQCLFALDGPGANGKSTLLEVFLYVWGDYGQDLPFNALEAKRNGSVPGEAVNLPGARFVKSVEIREGKQLDEARIKSLTGGDTITIRPLYRNSFSFKPSHKLWLAFNHKPVITDNSPAMWRRVRLIPFRATFAGKQADKSLLEKLKGEAPGILNWLIEACLLWQHEGLDPLPAVVKQETQMYRQESDSLEPFLDDCCAIDSAGFTPSKELWQVYLDWARGSGERTLSRKAFVDRLRARFFTPDEEGHAKIRVWRGLVLRKELADAGVRADAGADFQNPSITSLHGRV